MNTYDEMEAKRLVQHMSQLRKESRYAAARALGEEARVARAAEPRAAEIIDVARALAFYKDPDYGLRPALMEARALVAPHLMTSNDAETFGVAGAIEKRFYDLDLQPPHLERALQLYTRGHECDRAADWSSQGYPGINVAYMLDLLATQREAGGLGIDTDGAGQLRAEARRVREELLALPALPQTATGDAHYFREVTVAEAYLGLDDFDRARDRFAAALAFQPSEWMVRTTAEHAARHLRAKGPIAPEARGALAALLGRDANAVCDALRGRLGVGLSGGGFRASLFHIGVLARLADLGLLRHVEVISCVSGGSIIGALYYLELKALYERKADAEIQDGDFVELVKRIAERFPKAIRKNIRTRVAFSPADNFAMLEGTRSRTIRAGELYEEFLYREIGPNPAAPSAVPGVRELSVVPPRTKDFRPREHNWRRRAKVPEIVFNATSLNTGHAWHFTPTGMGEPAAIAEKPVEANDRFEHQPYAAFGEALGNLPLGHAVAASACVPAIFDPLELRGAYGEHTVQLVDGGVHDNQGIAALLESDCTSIIVSDASGQLSLASSPPNSALHVASRANSVLQARVREAQLLDLRSRERGRLLAGLAFFYLKQDLKPGVVHVGGLTTGTLPAGQLTPYGVSRAVQERLAGLRTDLDAFSELEAEALMMSGFAIAGAEIDAKAFEPPHPRDPWQDAASPAERYGFSRVWPLMTAAPGASPGQDRVLELLGVGENVVGKVFRVSPLARSILIVTAMATLASGLVWVWSARQSVALHVTVGALATSLFYAALAWRVPTARPWIDVASGDLPIIDWLRKWAFALFAAGIAHLSVRFADREFLRTGEVGPLLEIRKNERHYQETVPELQETPVAEDVNG